MPGKKMSGLDMLNMAAVGAEAGGPSNQEKAFKSIRNAFGGKARPPAPGPRVPAMADDMMNPDPEMQRQIEAYNAKRAAGLDPAAPKAQPMAKPKKKAKPEVYSAYEDE